MSVAPDGFVTVRMYNVGFGDAFLLLFPGADRPQRVLIDCGSHFLGKGPQPLPEIVDQIVRDVTDDDGVARIDVVVGTHRHQDHVSGFDNAAWQLVEVGEVWMPWTEDPRDPEARRIRESQSGTAKRLILGLEAMGGEDDMPAMQLANNALANDKAMSTLHRGFTADPIRRFLPEEGSPEVLATSALSGIRVHVLGPSRDSEVIRDMNPPLGESYLWLAASKLAADGSAPPAPFTDDWEIDVETYERGTYASNKLSPTARGRYAQLGDIDPFEIAVALERAVNGTSLVLAFEIGAALLLFPGDAQWGTWAAMLRDEETQALLERTTFLKVGHHGSHNGTPREFVRGLASAREERGATADQLWAMVSTRRMPKWEDLPKEPLLEALRAVTPQVARSDAGASQKVGGFTEWGEAVIEAAVPIH